MRRKPVVLATAVLLAAAASPTQADAKLQVVATLSTFADLVETIGGEHVEVSSIASPRFNPHFIEPKPSDVLRVKRADLFVHAGLDLELWRYPLVDAAGNVEARPGGARELDLSQGVRLLEVPTEAVTRAQGDLHLYGNPHYWLSPEQAKVMAQTIARKLTALDPAHGAAYEARLARFRDALDAAIDGWRARTAAVRGRELIGYHNAWPYLMEFLGLRMEQFLEPKPGIPPTPRQISFLEGYIRERGIGVIVQATFFPRTAGDSLAGRTGARVVTLCQNVHEIRACADYLSTIDYNVTQLTGALAP